MMKPQMNKRLALCAAILGLVGACCMASPAQSDAEEKTSEVAVVVPTHAQVGSPTTLAKESAVMEKRDIVQDGKPACYVEFAYAGYVPETLIWEGENCDGIAVGLLDPDQLGKLGKWELLDEFAQKHVQALAQGEVLYVEGEYSASVFPVGTTGQSYEVVVAD